MAGRTFFEDEVGAATTDWVVLSGALVGLGLASLVVVSGGVGEISNEVSIQLSEQMRAASSIATAALSATDIWNDPTASFRDLANVEQFSFSTVVDLTSGSSGIIFETGGGVWGTVLYQHDGVLYLQAGRGNDYGEAHDRGEASWLVSDGRATIEGSLDAENGLALIVNGEVVDQSSFNAPRLAGGNPGSVSGSNSGVASNRGGFNRHDAGHPGVEEVVFYEGQTTGDEIAQED